MKHIVILNPAAGKNGAALEFKPKMEAFFEAHPMEHTYYVTTHPGEATDIVRRECAEGDVRVYACGGDGTVLEVLNGIDGAPHAELASVPCGSGNDFLRMFENTAPFLDPAALVAGEAVPIDIMHCDGRLALNMCSMGMDANVADRMVHYKRLPLVSGSMAYNLAIARTFFGRLGQRLRIEMETEQGTVTREGEYLFALAANGPYYGGGYKGSPLSVPNDGLLDFVLVRDLNHASVLRFLGTYKRGEHLGLSCCETFRGTRMKVYAETPAVVTADGECFRTVASTFDIVPDAVRFVVPSTLSGHLLIKCKKPEFSQIGT